MISKTAYVSGEPIDRDGVHELRALAHLAASVLARTETWLLGGEVIEDVALALVQNALPLLEGASALTRLQRHSHARILAALLLLLDDPDAAALATDLTGALQETGPRERVLA